MAKTVLKFATGGISAVIGGKAGKVIRAVGLIALGVATGNPFLITAGLQSGVSALQKKPGVNRANQGRLFASVDPNASRKMVFGRTAMATDVAYQGYTGTDQEYYHQIIICASHAVEAVEELWLDDKQAWSLGGGVTSTYAGYLTVVPVLEGNAGNIINIDAKWGGSTNRRLTGCAYLHLRFKLTGNSKKSESPFSSGVPSRVTIIGKGLRVYDPRRDSTRGGSGTQRANDQTTWAWAVSADQVGRNPALCELAWLIGWRINGKLAVGRGLPLARIDFAAFITAANACDDLITLAAGGTEPRYRFDGITGEDEDGGQVRGIFEAAMNAKTRDGGGMLGLQVIVNDISSPIVTFTDSDFMGGFEWLQTGPLEDDRNIGRGRYTDARTSALYQLSEFPQVVTASPDGIDRVLSIDYAGVQSVSQAQRLMKQEMQRRRYPGQLTSTVNTKGWAVRAGDPVRVTLANLGFANKPFRVASAAVDQSGRVPIILIEEAAALYAWSAEDAPAPTQGGTVLYDPLNDPLVKQIGTIDTGATRNVDRGAWSGLSLVYTVGDEVVDGGSTWQARTNHSSAPGNGPPTLPTTINTNWILRAKAGDAGAAGVDGVTILASVNSIAFACTSAGVLKDGQITQTFNVTVRRGATVLNSSCDFSGSLFSGCTGSVASDGTVSFATVTAASGTVTVKALTGGVTYSVTVGFDKVLDEQSAPGGTSSSVNSFNAVPGSRASYTATPDAITGTVSVPSSGKILGQCAFSYDIAGTTTGSITLSGKLMYRVNGGAWVDTPTSTAAAGTSAARTAYSGDPPDVIPGDITFPSFTKTGLTAGALVEIGCFMYRSAGSTTRNANSAGGYLTASQTS